MNNIEKDTDSKIYQKIIAASVDGEIENLKKILEENPKIDISFDNSQLLRLSAFNGHLNIVQYLIEQGIEITLENKGEKIFLWEVCLKSLPIVQYLYIQHPNKKLMKDFIIKMGRSEMIEWVNKYNAAQELEIMLEKNLALKNINIKKTKI